MKKVILVTIGSFLGLQISAQFIQKVEMEMQSLSIEIADQELVKNNLKSPTAIPEAAGDTIWYEDFGGGIPAGWTLGGADVSDCPWKYSLVGGSGYFNGSYPAAADPMTSATAANGFLLCDPDSANQSLYGQPSGANYVYLESNITTTAIDLSAHPAVRLEFEQFFRFRF